MRRRNFTFTSAFGPTPLTPSTRSSSFSGYPMLSGVIAVGAIWFLSAASLNLSMARRISTNATRSSRSRLRRSCARISGTDMVVRIIMIEKATISSTRVSPARDDARGEFSFCLAESVRLFITHSHSLYIESYAWRGGCNRLTCGARHRELRDVDGGRPLRDSLEHNG